jgi:hypothetical protein
VLDRIRELAPLCAVSARGREHEARVRRDVPADLEDDLVAVVQEEASRIDVTARAIDVDRHAAPEARQPRRRERLSPDGEDGAEPCARAVEPDDTRRVDGPDRGATACSHDVSEPDGRPADADPGRDDHDTLPREQLDVDPEPVSQRRGATGDRRGRRPARGRVVQRPDAHRRRHRGRQRGDREGREHPHRYHGTRLLPVALAVAGLLAAAGCGGGSSGGPTVTVGAARTYRVAGFGPTTGIRPGKPTLISFTIMKPDGTPLTQYKEGSGPHNGVDLIIVRSDDSHVLYEDTDIHARGKISQPVVFPAPGRYRVVIDAYPKQNGPTSPFNFQLFEWVTVGAKKTAAAPLPAFSPTDVVGGYRFTLVGKPKLHAIEPAFLTFRVTDSAGRPARFPLWRGALAHAIFIRDHSLDYFHTHVCAPGATNCGTKLGGASVQGTSSKPGTLKVGVLVPVPGTWRLFLLTYVGGEEHVAPFTLKVS